MVCTSSVAEEVEVIGSVVVDTIVVVFFCFDVEGTVEKTVEGVEGTVEVRGIVEVVRGIVVSVVGIVIFVALLIFFYYQYKYLSFTTKINEKKEKNIIFFNSICQSF